MASGARPFHNLFDMAATQQAAQSALGLLVGVKVHPYSARLAALFTTRVATATPVTITSPDWLVGTNLAVAGAVAVNLPASPVNGQTHVIKDLKGDAGANNITITPAAGTIDGAATYVISTDRGKVTLAYTGSEWSIIG